MFRRENLVPFISEANSTTTVLSANETFTGIAQYVLGYINLKLIISSDVVSQNCGIVIQFSQDGTNWDFDVTSSYHSANMEFSEVFPVKASYFRILYTNGSTDQTHFRLQTILYPNDIKTSLVTAQQVKFTQETYDAFGRSRVSEPVTLFEIHHVMDKMSREIDELTSGSGSLTHSTTNSYVSLDVADSGVGKVIRQSYEYVPYQPGKSKMMLFTGVIEDSGGVDGAVCRIGCFDSNVEKTDVAGAGNGLFFELNGTTMYVVERLNNTDTKVAQTSWNYDKFDGKGPSGLVINNYSYALIYVIDQEWLGVGRVRYGFHINGEFKIGHIINHSGYGYPSSIPIEYPYTKTAKLPIRYEIQTSSAVNAKLKMICSSVISEGGFEPKGYLHTAITSSATSITTTNIVPLLSIRLRETEPYNRATLILKSARIILLDNKYIRWYLYLLPNDTYLTGESFTNVDTTYSKAQYDESATAVTTSGAILLDSGFIEQSSSSSYNFEYYLASPLVNSSITGKSRILALCAQKISTNINVEASISWLEVL